MPTLLQRIHVLAAGDSERERSWRAARKFALATHDNQVVHVEGQEQRILPHGGLSTVQPQSRVLLLVSYYTMTS